MDITENQAKTVKGAVLKYRMDRSSPDDVMTVDELSDFINKAMPRNIPLSTCRLRSWIRRNKADRIYLTLMEQAGGEPAELAKRILATNPGALYAAQLVTDGTIMSRRVYRRGW